MTERQKPMACGLLFTMAAKFSVGETGEKALTTIAHSAQETSTHIEHFGGSVSSLEGRLKHLGASYSRSYPWQWRRFHDLTDDHRDGRRA